jgi:hypothetical protein
MTAIMVRNFLGEVPLVSAQMLPDGTAVTARDVNLQHGNLHPWKSPTTVATPSKTGVKKTIYRFGEQEAADTQYWFTWTTDVDVVRAPISGDTTERTYFSGDGAPKKTNASLAQTGGSQYPMNAYKLGVPMPDTSLCTVVAGGSPTDPTSEEISVAYVVTYVTHWDEEGAPGANGIGPVTFRNGQDRQVNNLPTAPTGNYNLRGKRIYRAVTGSSASAYQYVTEIPLSQTTFSDTFSDTDLEDVLQTTGWFEPPDTAFGLTLGANGNAILLDGKTIYPCVPFALYAYPDVYQLNTESELVGAGAFAQGFAILTKSNPYIITGVDPASYTMTRLDTNQACVSKRSIVEMMGGVVYASPDGLWAIDGNGLRSLTSSLLSKEDWQALVPSSIHAYELDGRYHAFYDTGTVQGCLIFDFGRVPYLIRSNQYCTAAYNDPLRDTLYMAQGGNITKWDAGAAMTYLWRSKDYRFPAPTSLAFGKVEAKSYPVTLRVYYDGALVHTQAVASAKPFRLPAGKAVLAAFEVEGTAIIDGVILAGTAEELYKL